MTDRVQPRWDEPIPGAAAAPQDARAADLARSYTFPRALVHHLVEEATLGEQLLDLAVLRLHLVKLTRGERVPATLGKYD